MNLLLPVALRETCKYSIYAALNYFPLPLAEKNHAEIPRMKVSELSWEEAKKFNGLMQKHSFVVLEDDTGRIEKTYLNLMAMLKEFFDKTVEGKGFCKGDIYFNERGIPMWNTGYEKCDEMREAFRVHAGKTDEKIWPDQEFKKSYLELLSLCQKICNRALSLVLGYQVCTPINRAADDFSVCYALSYPNDCSKYQEIFNVSEHVDVSLFVIEPCCGVEGLEVKDLYTGNWVGVESICKKARDIVLFGGKALEDVTSGVIKGTLHRVRRGDIKRQCFIFEQKYRDYFDAPLD